MTKQTRRLSPATALGALAVGHTAWGLVAYRDQLPGIVSDVPGSVGDGIFDKAHSRDERAAAFWFLFVSPLLALVARLYASAEAADDRPAMRTAGRMVTGVCAACWAIIPRSGFPAGLGLGLWMTRWAKPEEKAVRR